MERVRYMKTIETNARAFLILNILAIGRVYGNNHSLCVSGQTPKIDIDADLSRIFELFPETHDE